MYISVKMKKAPIKTKRQGEQQSKTLSTTKVNPVPYLSAYLSSTYKDS